MRSIILRSFLILRNYSSDKTFGTIWKDYISIYTLLNINRFQDFDDGFGDSMLLNTNLDWVFFNDSCNTSFVGPSFEESSSFALLLWFSLWGWWRFLAFLQQVLFKLAQDDTVLHFVARGDVLQKVHFVEKVVDIIVTGKIKTLLRYKSQLWKTTTIRTSTTIHRLIEKG